MNAQLSTLHIARIVIEAVTPLSVCTGNPDGVFDTALITDANHLPAIPSTAVAGVLRHLWVDTYGEGAESSANDLFGYQHGNSGTPSRVTVSWGTLMDSQGRAAEGLLLGNKQSGDALLNAAAALVDEPVVRNRVRLRHKGVTSATEKFDRAVLPAGHRFAFELRLWSEQIDDIEWEKLLALLSHPGFRLGGATRAGLGKMGVVSLHRASFNLRDAVDAAAFCSLASSLSDTDGLRQTSVEPKEFQWLSGTLVLEPCGFWRIGQGAVDPYGMVNIPKDKPADLLPVTEECIQWPGGTPQRALLLPASSIKGALAHRLAFHANRYNKRWAEDASIDPDRCHEVNELFGQAKENESGRAGCFYLDDTFIPIEKDRLAVLMHNSIDRFTGGVRNRMLFSEESVYGGCVNVPVAIDLARLDRTGRSEPVRRALKAALDDLCEGRLALGSRTASGNGFFMGRVEGALGKWLAQVNNKTEVA